MRRNIKIVLEYDGTNYFGWQAQDDVPTIQRTLQVAIKDLTGEEVVLYAAGRTDTGVHARGQVVNFYTNSTIPDFAFAKALNAKLPHDISIHSSCQVDENFHAQFQAKSKAYSYRIFCSKTRPAIGRFYSLWIWYPLDVVAMRSACQYFLGEQDFTSFEASNSPRKSSVRTVYQCEIREESCYIIFFISANGFLYHMVRNIVGTLLKIGQNKQTADSIKEILSAKNRALAGSTAPSYGLTLEYVQY